jgi:hypothetical protein
MLNIVELMMITQILEMKQQSFQHRNDGTTEYVNPMPIQLSRMDRITDSVGDVLINVGKKLKQHSHAHLAPEQTQAPNFMIML